MEQMPKGDGEAEEWTSFFFRFYSIQATSLLVGAPISGAGLGSSVCSLHVSYPQTHPELCSAGHQAFLNPFKLTSPLANAIIIF